MIAFRGMTGRSGCALVGALAIVVTLVGCSSSSKGSAHSSGPAGTGDASSGGALAGTLQAGYRGAFDPPPSSGPKAVPGKTVWDISCGQVFATCAYFSEQFADAGHALGWTVITQDSKGDPTTAVNLIKQAVAAKVDGIAMVQDCPNIRAGLQAARDAHIPTVSFGSDCDDPGFSDGGTPLFTAALQLKGYHHESEFYQAWGRARADYLLAKMSGSGKILDVHESTSLVERVNDAGFTAEITSQCPKCRLVHVNYAFSQMPQPATQIWKSALLANPDAKAVAVDSDQIMGLGMQSALQQPVVRNRHLLVVGGEGGLLNYNLIRQGVETESTALAYDWALWGLADTLNRIFAGESPAQLPSEGGGWQYVDQDHNLPPTGKPLQVPIDFRSAYTKIWQGQ